MPFLRLKTLLQKISLNNSLGVCVILKLSLQEYKIMLPRIEPATGRLVCPEQKLLLAEKLKEQYIHEQLQYKGLHNITIQVTF